MSIEVKIFYITAQLVLTLMEAIHVKKFLLTRDMIQVITRLRIVDLINTQIKAKPAAGRLLLGLNVRGTI